MLELQPPNSTLAQLYSVIIIITAIFILYTDQQLGPVPLHPLQLIQATTKSAVPLQWLLPLPPPVLPGAMEMHPLPNTYSILPALSCVSFLTL